MEISGFHPRDQQVWVERWPTETPLQVLVGFAAAAMWLFLALTIFGMIYVVLIGLFLFFSHLGFIAYLRGSAVRLGPEQLPELHARVQKLARRVGLKKMPVVYVMQAGGVLNALATKFAATDFVVLFSDLLEACGDNTEARDMIIGHELGHLKEGHLRWIWFLAPGLFVPFLGTAYSRAREYTCDRYGAAVCDTRDGALRGLAILSAGAVHGPKVNLGALARQRADLNTAWMTIGHWLGTHPALAHRVAALDPGLDPVRSYRRGPVGAVAILSGFFLVPLAVGVAVPLLLTTGLDKTVQAEGILEGPMAEEGDGNPDKWEEFYHEPPTVAAMFGAEFAAQQIEADFVALADLIEEYHRQVGAYPANPQAMMVAWQALRPGRSMPIDPYDGFLYGYESSDAGYRLWSVGPDADDPGDDIQYPPSPVH